MRVGRTKFEQNGALRGRNPSKMWFAPPIGGSKGYQRGGKGGVYLVEVPGLRVDRGAKGGQRGGGTQIPCFMHCRSWHIHRRYKNTEI